jgi:hypothetical protein
VAEVAGHSSAAELGERFRAAADARSARHVQAIWLLAKGHAAAEVASTTAFGVRRVEELPARYDASGPDTLGDLRRHNGARRTVLTPALLDELRARLTEPPPDGGLCVGQPRGRSVDGGGARAGRGGGPARPGGAAGGRVAGPGAAAGASGAGHGGRARGL